MNNIITVTVSFISIRLFLQIHQRLDALYRSLPKLHRCSSEPSVNAARFERTDTSELTAFMNISPKTPFNVNVMDSVFFFSGRKDPRDNLPTKDKSNSPIVNGVQIDTELNGTIDLERAHSELSHVSQAPDLTGPTNSSPGSQTKFDCA